tara:strand:+ start:204 stop:410 length:207 start_codon:yes stop_codon:yes gene_type:complete
MGLDKPQLFKGMIIGIEEMGAKLIKYDLLDLFFEVKIGSQIDDQERLKRSKDAFLKTFGLGMKIKRVK